MRTNGKKLLLFIALFWSLALSPVNAANQQLLSPDELAWLNQHPDPIRVHNELDWRPYNFNEAGEPKGYSIDYMNLVAKKLDIPIRYVSGPSWSEFLEMMQSGSLDLMVNIASTKDRRPYLSFSEPYLITFTSLYVRNSENSISDLDDMAGKKIAFTKGFFFGEFIRKYYPDIEIVTFDSTLASFIGVDMGLADAAIEVSVVAQRTLLEAKLTSLKKGGDVSDPRFITTFAIATRKDETTLLGIIQKGIDAITSDEELSIRRKWNLEESELPLISTDQRKYLNKLGELHVCVNPDRLPLEAVNLDGSLTGISSELVKLLEEKLQIPLNVVKTSSWVESIKLASMGKCDLLPMAIRTDERDQYLDFTSPWLLLPYVVATRHDQIYISSLDQVIDKEIGVVTGLATGNNLLAVYPKIKLVEVASVSEGLKKVDSGKLFGFVDTIPTISRTLQAEAITGVKISGDVGASMNYAIGVNGDDGQLLRIMERSLGAIEKDMITSIYNRWLAVAYIDRPDYTRFWQVLLGLFLVTLYFYYRYRRGLQVTAALRTAHAEVEDANRKLDKQAHTDVLTGIANRLKTDEELQREFNRFERSKESFSILLLDIDHFKQVNDNYGHHVGDEVLKSVAGTLSHNTRMNDVLGRWGGEEFIVICPSTALEGAVRLAENLRLAISNSTMKHSPSQTASFGVATIRDGDCVHDVVKRADDALYQAKKRGRNRVEQSPQPID